MRQRDTAGIKGPYPSRNLLTAPAVDFHFKRQKKPIVVGKDVIRTPFRSWDDCCMDGGGRLGLAMGWHTIVAGNTGAGKSILALNAAASAVIDGVSVGFVSLEMSQEQLMSRILGMLTGEPVAKMQRGPEYDPHFADFIQERLQEKIGKARLMTNDDAMSEHPLHQIDEIVDLCTYWIEELGCKMLILDYMQLAGFGSSEKVAERVTEISRAIRGVAHHKKVVTMGLSQFNRTTSANYTDKPKVQGLFGASGMENDANQVVMIDHSRYEKTPQGNRTYVLVGKNRHGPTPEIPILLDTRSLQMIEAMPHEESQWPT